MLLGLNALGEDAYSFNVLPKRKSQVGVKIYGESVIDAVNFLKVELADEDLIYDASSYVPFLDSGTNNIELSDGNIFNVITSIGQPEFGFNSIFVSNFENTLESGNLTNDDTLITTWMIRRQIVGESLNPKLVELSVASNPSGYTDVRVSNRTNYTYTVAPVSGSGNTRIEGIGLEGVGYVDFFGWILSDTSANPVTYKFDMEVDSNDIKVNKGMKMFENYTKFPSFRFSNMEYRSSSLKTIPYVFDDVTGNYNFTDSNLKEIVAFINDGNEKILRTPSGDVLRVVTSNASYKYMDATYQQISTLNFDFIECGEVI